MPYTLVLRHIIRGTSIDPSPQYSPLLVYMASFGKLEVCPCFDLHSLRPTFHLHCCLPAAGWNLTFIEDPGVLFFFLISSPLLDSAQPPAVMPQVVPLALGAL